MGNSATNDETDIQAVISQRTISFLMDDVCSIPHIPRYDSLQNVDLNANSGSDSESRTFSIEQPPSDSETEIHDEAQNESNSQSETGWFGIANAVKHVMSKAMGTAFENAIDHLISKKKLNENNISRNETARVIEEVQKVRKLNYKEVDIIKGIIHRATSPEIGTYKEQIRCIQYTGTKTTENMQCCTVIQRMNSIYSLLS